MKLLTVPGVSFRWVGYAGGSILLAGDLSRGYFTMRFWRLGEGGPPQIIPHPESLAAGVLLDPEGEHLLRVQGLWPEGEELPPRLPCEAGSWHPFFGPGNGWHRVTVSPDGATVLLAWEGHHTSFSRPWPCEPDPPGRYVGGYRTFFHLSEPDRTLRPLYCAACTFGARAAFSPDGRLAAMSAGNRVVAVWDVAGRREVCRFIPSDKVLALAFVSDGRLAVAAGRTVQLWDAASGGPLSRFRAFRKYADALAVSRAGLLAAGSLDGVVRLWEARTGREVGHHDWGVGEVHTLAFSPDGTTAAVTGRTGLVVWDLD